MVLYENIKIDFNMYNSNKYISLQLMQLPLLSFERSKVGQAVQVVALTIERNF